MGLRDLYEMEAEAGDPTDLGQDLNDLWNDERCTWRVEHHGGDGNWVVILEWTQEYENPHHADWVTYTWQFYGDTVDGALQGAADWCWALAPLRPCGECAEGMWMGEPCDRCHGTGLADSSLSGAQEATDGR